MKRYLLYIFDLDGTLIDSLNGLKVCYRQALDELGVEYDSEEVVEFTRESLRSTYDRFENLGVSYDRFEEIMYMEYRNTLDPNSPPYPDTLPTLKELKKRGASLCIATKSFHDRARNVLEIHGLIDCFDYIIGYDDVELQKPHPECLELCTSRYDIDKKDIVFVGDNDIDIMAADSFGIDGVFIDRGKTEVYEGTYNITDLRELL